MPKTVIRLLGDHGLELDSIVQAAEVSEKEIKRAVIELAMRCTLRVGDTITITREA